MMDENGPTAGMVVVAAARRRRRFINKHTCSTNRLFSAPFPTLTRIHPSQPCSSPLNRTKMPAECRSSPTSSLAAALHGRLKLPPASLLALAVPAIPSTSNNTKFASNPPLIPMPGILPRSRASRVRWSKMAWSFASNTAMLGSASAALASAIDGPPTA